MATKQNLKCPECNTIFEYDPHSDETVLTFFDKSPKLKLKKPVQVVAYLECPNGHTKPYKVFKDY